MIASATALAAATAGVLIVPRALVAGTTTYETAKGELRRVTLPDGSTLVLDTATRLSVQYGDDQRLVLLHHGRAYFDVAKDPARAFRVFAGSDEVRAIGTAFQVRFEDGKASVILEEGRVAVFRRAASDSARTAVARTLPSEKPSIVLKPGQAVQLGTVTSRAAVMDVDLAETNAWQDGELVFDDVPLPDAIAELNRYGGRSIVLNDTRLMKLRVSGTFHTNRPESFVEGITVALPVRLQESNATELILTAS